MPGVDTPDAIDPRLHALAQDQGLTVEPLKGGFTAALQNLADHTDAATTSTTAKMIGYPATDLNLGNAHESWRPVLLAIAALTVAVLVGLTPAFLVRRRRRRGNQAGSLPIASSASDSEAARDGASVTA